MISVEQWRAAIDCFYCSQQNVNVVHGNVHSCCISVNYVFLIVCFIYAYIICALILLLAGDIETNPGPMTRLCPECSTPIHIKKVQCVYCGHVLLLKKDNQ